MSETQAPVFIADTIVDTSDAANKRVPVEKSDTSMIGYDHLSDIPEIRAIVELMREEMARVRNDRSVAEFIRKQKFKKLEADYSRLGGRTRAMVKILSLLKANPDHYEVQEDMKDCSQALALLIQELARRYRFDVAARCREMFPLTAEQEKERDEYEAQVIAAREAAAETVVDAEATEDQDPDDAFEGIDAVGALR